MRKPIPRYERWFKSCVYDSLYSEWNDSYRAACHACNITMTNKILLFRAVLVSEFGLINFKAEYKFVRLFLLCRLFVALFCYNGGTCYC